MWRRICPAASSRPTPNPSTPALLLTVVRFLVPFLTRARIKFSGLPHRPKPPIMMLAPSGISRTASSALPTTLFISGNSTFRSHLDANFLIDHRGHRVHRGSKFKFRLVQGARRVSLQPSSTQVEIIFYFFLGVP